MLDSANVAALALSFRGGLITPADAALRCRRVPALQRR